MEIKFEEKIFQIPDACPIDAPKNRVLKRHLREHGIESLLASKKLSEFSGCVLDELLEQGAVIVESVEANKQVPSSESTEGHPDNQGDPIEPKPATFRTP